MSSFDTENNRVVGGNYGLMDQKLALEFIFEHSVAIGGNGDRLTINGESAGAWSCSSQLIHPDSGKEFELTNNSIYIFSLPTD
jgi:carboxylesterase type B